MMPLEAEKHFYCNLQELIVLRLSYTSLKQPPVKKAVMKSAGQKILPYNFSTDAHGLVQKTVRFLLGQ